MSSESSAPSVRGYGHKYRLHFDGDERKFELWHAKFMGYLRLRGLIDIVDPSQSTTGTGGNTVTAASTTGVGETTGTNTTTTGGVSDAEKNAEVYAELIQYIDDRSLSLVLRDATNDGRKAIQILREHYMGKGKPRIITLWTELSLLNKPNSESITDYIIRAENAVSALRNAGEAVSDSLLIAMVLKGLPDSYKAFEVVITQSHEVVTFADFKVSLKNFDDTENARRARENGRSDSVMYSSDNRHSGGGTNFVYKPPGGGKNDNGGKIKCNYCEKFGHKANKCNKKKRDKKQQWCSLCKNGSHSDRTCRKQQHSDKNNNGQGNTSANRMVEHSFQFAMKFGDVDVDPINHDGTVDTVLNNNIVVTQDTALTHDTVVAHAVVAHAEIVTHNTAVKLDTQNTVVAHDTDVEHYTVVTNDTVIAQNTVVDNDKDVACDSIAAVDGIESDTDRFLVDSGATKHVTNDDSRFISTDNDFKPHNHVIELADGSTATGVAIKKGTIEIALQNSEGKVVFGTLDNVLYVPSYPQNIFSVKAALRNKSSVHFNSDEPSYLKTPGGVLFHFEEHRNGLYYLHDHPKASQLSVAVSSTTESLSTSEDKFCTTRTVETWHKVLGHCNHKDVLKLPQIVKGMKISGSHDKFECGICHLGKMRQEISRTPDPRAKKPLEFVHTDLSGSIEPVSVDGHRYVISFTDDFSGYVFTYFLKVKSDSVKALEKFLADSAPCGVTNRMRCDNGGEFVGQDFKDVLVRNKIKQEPSCPDSPHQNGTAERWWSTCFGMSRCLLIESGLPKNLWPYAVMYATHIRNRCYQQRTGQTPYFMLTNRVPNVHKLAIFGSVCYAFDHQNPKKLDPRSKRGIFVGMDKDSPSYLVYFPDDAKIRKYRTVKCTDQMYYSKTQGHVGHSHVESEVESDDDSDFLIPQTPTRLTNASPPPPPPNDIPPPHVVPQSPVGAADEVVLEDTDQNDGGAVMNESGVGGGQNDAQLMGVGGRYPQRERRPPAHLRDYDTTSDEIVDQINTNIDYCYTASAVHIPKLYKDAVASSEAVKWKIAMDTEISALNDNKTYSLVPLPAGKKAISGRWVYAVKKNLDGTDLFKARYVARGFTQVYGSDYFETFSPTAKMTAIRMLIQYAVQNDLLIHQLDVKTAYLNAPIDCEIYMTQPEGYAVEGKEHLVCHLHKSLYGLKQSGRNWNILLTNVLKKNDFNPSVGDPCLYISKTKDLILYWVDDIVVACKSMPKMNKITNILKGKFKMKDLGVLKHFLGMRFEISNSRITIDQSLYLSSILNKYKMSDCKARATPCELPGSVSTQQQLSDQNLDPKKYREIVGSLIYATTCTRPDIAWVVSRLSQNLASPRDIDWIMLKHVLRYVKGTVSYKLHYTKYDGVLALTGFSDSDWASCTEDRRSTSGYCFYMNINCSPVSWKSKKQPTVALSSCEAEYMALGLSTQEAIYLQRFTTDFDLSTDPVLLYSDNQGALDLVKNPVNHARTKHIDIKHHFVREKLVGGVIDYQYIPTDINVADVLTKALPKPKLQSFLPKLLLC